MNSEAETIRWFIEGQAFSSAYDLAPHSPLSRQYVVSDFLCAVGRRECVGGGEPNGKEPNHTTARKPGPLYIIQYSLLRSIWKRSLEIGYLYVRSEKILKLSVGVLMVFIILNGLSTWNIQQISINILVACIICMKLATSAANLFIIVLLPENLRAHLQLSV